MSANHHFFAWQQTDATQPLLGKWFVDDTFGQGSTVAGPFDEQGDANKEADARNGEAFVLDQRTGYAGIELASLTGYVEALADRIHPAIRPRRGATAL